MPCTTIQVYAQTVVANVFLEVNSTVCPTTTTTTTTATTATTTYYVIPSRFFAQGKTIGVAATLLSRGRV